MKSDGKIQIDFSKSVLIIIYLGGVDETGSLYNIENIKYFSKLFRDNKADLVSADGGFDFSSDYSNQEISATRLVLCEIITGLSVF